MNTTPDKQAAKYLAHDEGKAYLLEDMTTPLDVTPNTASA